MLEMHVSGQTVRKQSRPFGMIHKPGLAGARFHTAAISQPDVFHTGRLVLLLLLLQKKDPLKDLVTKAKQPEAQAPKGAAVAPQQPASKAPEAPKAAPKLPSMQEPAEKPAQKEQVRVILWGHGCMHHYVEHLDWVGG
jgi:hypothetical protein